MGTALPMDKNHNRSGDLMVASKSVGSFIKIDSISINLADATGDQIRAGKCEHFTIRGYVSEVRKKDWKLCWPFAADGDLNKLEQIASLLPPLDPPNSKLRSCLNCMPEVGPKSIEKDHVTKINFCDFGANQNNTGAEMSPVSDAPVLLPCQQDPKSKVVEGDRVEVHTSTTGNGNEQHPSSCTVGEKEGKHEVVPATVAANVEKAVPKIWDKKLLADALEDDVIETSGPNSVETEVNPERMQETHRDETEAPRLEGNGSIEVCEPGCEIHEDTIVELDLINKKFLNKNSTQTSEAEGQTSAEDHNKERMIASGTSKIAGIVEAHKATKVRTSIDHPIVLDECENAFENLDKSNGLNRKKSRRVRVRKLSELGDAKTDCIRKENSPSNTISNTSGAGAVSPQVPVQGNTRAGPGENKKRKSPDKEQGGQEVSPPKSLNRKVKASKLGEETIKAIADSQLEEDSVARLSSRADMHINGTRNGIERVPTTGKKKTLKSSDCGASSSLVPPEDNVPAEVDTIGNSGKCNATRRSRSLTYDVSTDRGKDQVPFLAPKAGRKSDFCKSKDKMPEVDNEQDSIFPWSMLPNGSNTRKNVAIVQTGHPFHPTEDASSEKGLELSLNSYLPTQTSERKSIPQSEDGSPSLQIWKDSTCKLDEFMRRNVEANYAANLNNLTKSISNALSGKGVHGELGSKFSSHGLPILNEKQNYSSQVEQTSFSLQKMNLSRARDKDKVIEVQKNASVPVNNRKQCNHIAEKTSQKGAADDPPMDVVEYMAWNQHERGGYDPEIMRLVSEKASKVKNGQVIDHSLGIGDLKILDETSQKPKTQERNAKSSITTMKKVGPAKQKQVDYSTCLSGKDFGGRLDQPPSPTGFTLSQPQKKSTRGPFPATDSNCRCARNCKWDGDMLGSGLPHSSSRTSASCNTNQSVPQSKQEAARLWSSVPVPAASTYRNPPNFPPQPSNASMLSPPPASLFKGSVHGAHDHSLLYRNATNHRKQNDGVGSESFIRNHAEYSFINRHHGTEPRRNDLHTGAMHLLSLAHYHASLKIPLPIDLNSKESSGVDIGAYKATDTVNHPSSNFCGKNNLSGKSLDLFPTPPTAGASTSSFQLSNGFKRAPEFIGEASLSSQKKQKMRRSSAPAHDRGPGSQKATSLGGGLSKAPGTIPVPSMQKGFHAVADLMMFTQHGHTVQYPMLQNFNGIIMMPPKSSSESLICSINKNPAEFTIPGVGNEYMIGGEDLKFGKQFSLGKRPGPNGLIKVDQNKQQRSRKQTTGKGLP